MTDYGLALTLFLRQCKLEGIKTQGFAYEKLRFNSLKGWPGEGMV